MVRWRSWAQHILWPIEGKTTETLKQTRVVKVQSTEILASIATRITVTVESHGQDSSRGAV